MNWVLFQTGFRPFFLGAAVLGASWVPLWALALAGKPLVAPPRAPIAWHSHEMVFGYALAVVAGFLLTAVQNWTGRTTARGAPLALLALSWLAGRVVMLVDGSWLAAAIDLSFVALLTVVIARPIVATRNRRNYIFIALLLLLAACNALTHAAALGVAVPLGRPAVLCALDTILALVVVVSGRIVPMFTRNALAPEQRAAIRQPDRRDLAATVSLVALALVELVPGVPATAFALVAGVSGVLQLWRLWGWGGTRVLDKPICWVLHLGYAWLGLGLLLRGCAPLWPPLGAAGIHVLAIGAVGALTLGMISRVALGHTGRPLRVTRPTVVAYLAITLAVPARVLAALAGPALYLPAIGISATLWSLALLLYLAGYTRILLGPRADGKPG